MHGVTLIDMDLYQSARFRPNRPEFDRWFNAQPDLRYVTEIRQLDEAGRNLEITTLTDPPRRGGDELVRVDRQVTVADPFPLHLIPRDATPSSP